MDTKLGHQLTFHKDYRQACREFDGILWIAVDTNTYGEGRYQWLASLEEADDLLERAHIAATAQRHNTKRLYDDMLVVKSESVMVFIGNALASL